ncbi:MAG: hypothetical protein Q8Q09_23225 [Deltaproteobacteria bacterium]|nr:hypothetical protein [Deltaproteobacteria bacterium]
MCASGAAYGNGRFPAAQLIHVSTDQRSVALRVTFGFMISEDGGQNFSWLCEEALGYGGGVFDPPFVLDANQRLHVALPDGLARLERDRCSTRRDPGLESQFVIDLDRTRDGQTVFAVTSSGAPGARNYVYRAGTSSERFEPLGAGFASDTLFETIEHAPSDPQRIYLTAVRNSPRRVIFLRSSDGGVTFEETSLDSFNVDDGYIAGVDPTNPDRVYVRAPLRDVILPDAGANASPTALLVTDDGGRTFRELVRSVGAMTGFALSDDGATLFFGTQHLADGLQRSRNRGVTFERVAGVHVTGLRVATNTLWVAANWVLDGFALGRSVDQGTTIVPAIRSFCDVQGAPACGPSTDVTALCGARWPVFRSSSLACPISPAGDAGDAGDAGASPIMDGSTIDDRGTSGPPGSCRCAIPAVPSRSTRGALWLSALSLALCATIARSRASAPA